MEETTTPQSEQKPPQQPQQKPPQSDEQQMHILVKLGIIVVLAIVIFVMWKVFNWF